MGRSHNQPGIYSNQEYGRDDSLGTEPQLERRQELSNGSRGHNEKSPKIGPNLTRFAYDRLNAHNPEQSLRRFAKSIRAREPWALLQTERRLTTSTAAAQAIMPTIET